MARADARARAREFLPAAAPRRVEVRPGWFHRWYPSLAAHWSNISKLKPRAAHAWLREQRVAGLGEREPEVFGVQISGRHVGVVGPAAILCALLYLFGYVWHLRSWGRLDGPSPWLCAMRGVPRWIGLFTVSVVPGAAVGLALWRLVEFAGWAAIVVGLGAGALGAWAGWIGRDLAPNPRRRNGTGPAA